MSPSKSHRDDYQRQVVSTPDVRMVPVAITACGMAAVGIGGHRWMILSAGIGCLAAGMIAVKRKAWLVVVSAAVGLTVLMSAGMRDLVVHHIGVAELAQEGAAVTVTGRVAADPRIFEVNGSGGSTVMITLVAHRIVAEAQAIDQSVRIVAMASGSTSGPATTVVVGQQVQVRGLLTPPREGRAEAAVLKLRAPPRVVAPPGPLDRGVNRFRAGLVSAVAGCPEGQRAIVPSLVVGGHRCGLGRDVRGVPSDGVNPSHGRVWSQSCLHDGPVVVDRCVVRPEAARAKGDVGSWRRRVCGGVSG